jgi:hypothetical protein
MPTPQSGASLGPSPGRVVALGQTCRGRQERTEISLCRHKQAFSERPITAAPPVDGPSPLTLADSRKASGNPAPWPTRLVLRSTRRVGFDGKYFVTNASRGSGHEIVPALQPAGNGTQVSIVPQQPHRRARIAGSWRIATRRQGCRPRQGRSLTPAPLVASDGNLRGGLW